MLVSAANPVSVAEPRVSVSNTPIAGSSVEAKGCDAVSVASSTLVQKQRTTLTAAQRQELTDRLLDQYYDQVYSYAYRLTGCPHAAQDVSQEAFLRAFSGIEQLRSNDAAGGWLLAIARNEAFRWCNKQSNWGSLEHDPAGRSDDQGRLDQQDWVQQALQQLPADFRIAVLMFYFEQKSYTQIADELKLPIGTVMSRLSRGKKHLKVQLILLEKPSKDTSQFSTTDDTACHNSHCMNKENS